MDPKTFGCTQDKMDAILENIRAKYGQAGITTDRVRHALRNENQKLVDQYINLCESAGTPGEVWESVILFQTHFRGLRERTFADFERHLRDDFECWMDGQEED